jgi:hypothetical protein
MERIFAYEKAFVAYIRVTATAANGLEADVFGIPYTMYKPRIALPCHLVFLYFLTPQVPRYWN